VKTRFQNLPFKCILQRYIVVFAELPPDAALVEQAEDRVHRRGQVGSVNVYFLVAHGPGARADERRWELIERSLDRVRQAMDAEGVDQATGLQPEAFGTEAMLPTPGAAEAAVAAAAAAAAAAEDEWAEPPPDDDEEEEEEETYEPPPPPADLWFEMSPHTGRVGAFHHVVALQVAF
jgi:hypothetical protein